jgi:hypothetical protein
LPVGRYRLFLSSTADSTGDSDDIVLPQGLTVYRRAPGKYETPSFANVVGPAALLIAGIVLVSIGPVVATAGAVGNNDTGATAAGVAMTVGGIAAAIGGGIWLYDARRAVQQEGATTAWQESPR